MIISALFYRFRSYTSLRATRKKFQLTEIHRRYFNRDGLGERLEIISKNEMTGTGGHLAPDLDEGFYSILQVKDLVETPSSKIEQAMLEFTVVIRKKFRKLKAVTDDVYKNRNKEDKKLAIDRVREVCPGLLYSDSDDPPTPS